MSSVTERLLIALENWGNKRFSVSKWLPQSARATLKGKLISACVDVAKQYDIKRMDELEFYMEDWDISAKMTGNLTDSEIRELAKTGINLQKCSVIGVLNIQCNAFSRGLTKSSQHFFKQPSNNVSTRAVLFMMDLTVRLAREQEIYPNRHPAGTLAKLSELIKLAESLRYLSDTATLKDVLEIRCTVDGKEKGLMDIINTHRDGKKHFFKPTSYKDFTKLFTEQEIMQAQMKSR